MLRNIAISMKVIEHNNSQSHSVIKYVKLQKCSIENNEMVSYISFAFVGQESVPSLDIYSVISINHLRFPLVKLLDKFTKLKKRNIVTWFL